jgi:cell wall-associated NlpC family hydrolase
MIEQLSLHKLFFSILTAITLLACAGKKNNDQHLLSKDTTALLPTIDDTVKSISTTEQPPSVNRKIITDAVQPDSLVAFAKTLIGIPYLYASTDPDKGFDCSGFITYVFNHFNVTVPRSSVDFTNYGKEVSIEEARPGDLILFTGTDSTIRVVGHMGIVESMQHDILRFIHSTSGKGKGVVITPFENYYRSRFVKVIRVFADELFE